MKKSGGRFTAHYCTPVQENGNTTTKLIFAEEKSRLTLMERVRKLNEESIGDLVRI